MKIKPPEKKLLGMIDKKRKIGKRKTETISFYLPITKTNAHASPRNKQHGNEREEFENVNDPGRHIQMRHAKKRKEKNKPTRDEPRFIGSASVSQTPELTSQQHSTSPESMNASMQQQSWSGPPGRRPG
jgi:hypothetical protein